MSDLFVFHFLCLPFGDIEMQKCVKKFYHSKFKWTKRRTALLQQGWRWIDNEMDTASCPSSTLYVYLQEQSKVCHICDKQGIKSVPVSKQNKTLELSCSLMEKLFHYQSLCLKGSGLWNPATKSCNSCKYFLLSRSKEYAEILGSSVQGYSYLSSPASPTVSLVSKAFWIKFSALVYGNPSSPPNAILPRVFLSEPRPFITKHREITAGPF